jgi:hypothetical protein
MPNRTDRTYVEDLEDPEEVIPPNRNLVFIVLRVEKSGDWIPFALFDDLRLDFGDRSEIETSVSGSLVENIAGMAHVVNCPIAPSTDRLSSSNRLPSTPRFRA